MSENDKTLFDRVMDSLRGDKDGRKTAEERWSEV